MFAASRTVFAGGTPTVVATGDFNHDGIVDYAAGILSNTNNLLIFLGQGDGNFKSAITNTVGPAVQSIAVADLNQDNNLDLIVGSSAAQIWVLAGKGDGSFQTATQLNNASGSAFALGKFNNDSNLDMVFGNNGGIGISTLMGNGNGTFNTGQTYIITTAGGEAPVSVAVGDMDGDGKPDLVTGTAAVAGPGHIAVLFGNGNGGFLTPISTPASTNNYCLALGDFNHDGKTDVAIGDYYANTVRIMLNNGDGTFHSNALITVSDKTQSLAVGYFDRDTNLDLMVGGGTNLMVLLGKANGTFQPPVKYIGLNQGVALADFDGDGKIDIAAVASTGGKTGIALGNGDGTFQIAPAYAVGEQPESVAIADFNGDGKGDMVIANFATNYVSVLLNRGDGTFYPATNYICGKSPQGVAIGDFNGDGTNDIAVTTQVSTNMISVLLGNGDGTFKAAKYFGTFGGGPLVLRDFNKDNKLDAIANSLFGIQVALGNGDGTFHAAASSTGLIGASPGSLAIADFNNDGTNDLALATGSTNVTILLGSTNGTWRAASNNYLAGTNVISVTAADFNGDGKIDLAAANLGNPATADGSVSILLGNGNGTFRPAVHYNAGAHPIFVTTGDFNGDGKLDLAVRNLLGFGVSIMLGNNDGTFQPAVGFGAQGDSTYSILAAGDLTGDGKPDLAVLNLNNSVTVILNTCAAIGPEISIIPSAVTASAFIVSWPIAASGFALQSVTDFNSTNWQLVTGPLTTNQGRVQLMTPFGSTDRFFRLRHP